MCKLFLGRDIISECLGTVWVALGYCLGVFAVLSLQKNKHPPCIGGSVIFPSNRRYAQRMLLLTFSRVPSSAAELLPLNPFPLYSFTIYNYNPMRSPNRLLAILCLFLTVSIGARAQVRLPKLVSDGMVLQRDAKVNIWGWASPGEKVDVK